MYVTVSITLAEGESPPAQDPKGILISLGGDPSKDTINVSVSASSVPPPVDLTNPIAPTA